MLVARQCNTRRTTPTAVRSNHAGCYRTYCKAESAPVNENLKVPHSTQPQKKQKHKRRNRSNINTRVRRAATIGIRWTSRGSAFGAAKVSGGANISLSMQFDDKCLFMGQSTKAQRRRAIMSSLVSLTPRPILKKWSTGINNNILKQETLANNCQYNFRQNRTIKRLFH